MVVDDIPRTYSTKNRCTIYSNLFEHGTKKVNVLYDLIHDPPEMNPEYPRIRTSYTYSNIILEILYSEHFFVNVFSFFIGNYNLDETIREEGRLLAKKPKIFKMLCDFERSGDLLIWAFDYLSKIESLELDYNKMLNGSSFEHVLADISALENATKYFKRFKRDELRSIEKQINSLKKIVKLKNRADCFPPQRSLKLIDKKFSKYLRLPLKERNSPNSLDSIILDLDIYRMIFR